MKIISNLKYDETLSLTECKDGYWLYDKTRGMNLSMRAKTKDEAFFKALKYYQERLMFVESELKALNGKVDQIADIFGLEEIDENKDIFYNNYR